MQIVCPKCSTAYEVPDTVFGGRPRKLRCVQCGHQWRGGPPEPAMEWSEGPAAALPRSAEPGAQPADQESQFLLNPEERLATAQEAEMDPVANLDAGPEAPAPEGGRIMGIEPGATMHDGFYDLVVAARNKAIEVEPEPPTPPKFRISSPGFFAVLALLFLVALALLEHQLVERLLPASAGLFNKIGM